jgi:hypothetical protein
MGPQPLKPSSSFAWHRQTKRLLGVLGVVIPQLIKRGVRKQMITPLDAPQEFLDEARHEGQVREIAQDTPLMRALDLAHHWQRLLNEGRFSSMTEIAEVEASTSRRCEGSCG